MGREDEVDLPIDVSQRRLHDILQNHGLRLAAVFGSTVRRTDEPADLDLLIEFEDHRPGDDGYASAYLSLYSALEDELAVDVDLVDVHTMSPGFGHIALEEAVLLVGNPDRLAALARRYADESPSVTDARERIAAAATRLGEEST